MIIPSIDLLAGKAVQLKNGKDLILERDNPLEIGEKFSQFAQIAVIDLDAAFGSGDNANIVRQLCQRFTCRVGGGIRSIEKAKEIISWGAEQIIIGTNAFKNNKINKKFLEELVNSVDKQRIIIAIDSLYGEIVTHGWKHKTGLITTETLPKLRDYSNGFLFSIVETEGALKGTDLFLIKSIKNLTNSRLTVAGGVSTLKELKILAELNLEVQLGMALYTETLKLEDCFIETLDWKKQELIPTITRDTNGEILMLGYSNKESLYKTIKTQNVTYFSRSRNTLWTKGETSGNFQKFIKIRTDCDRDTLLITANQIGNACHLNKYSCFGYKKFSIESLYEIVKNRFLFPKEGSYTVKLKDKKLLKSKIMEEASEVCSAKDKNNAIWEVADLLYFLTAFMVSEGIEIKQVLNELQRRNRV